MRRLGSLPHGRIEDLRVAHEHETFVSKLTFVEATYSADAPSELPRRLLVKSPLRPPTTTRNGMGEIEFYRRLAPLAGTPPIVRCVVRNLTMPILFWSQGMKRARWWYRLKYALAAYSDLSCEELL
jgi:hypothetical protein